jgi:hypothetical protein
MLTSYPQLGHAMVVAWHLVAMADHAGAARLFVFDRVSN